VNRARVFYFSGTGNTEFVSRLIERELRANQVEVDRRPLDFAEDPVVDGVDAVFLGFPVHGYGVPAPVREFIERLPRGASTAAVVFVTYGGWSCGAGQWAARLLAARGFRVVALIGVRMTHNNPPGVDVARQPVARLIEEARRTVAAAMPGVLASAEPIDTRSCSGSLVGSWINPLFADRRWMDFSFSRHAYADERCTACLSCARSCPTGSISLEDGRIQFGHGCASCLRCFNQCPAQAIQVGAKTRTAPRYRGPLGDYRSPVAPAKAG
jgi:flavodoxin/ferredoxin